MNNWNFDFRTLARSRAFIFLGKGILLYLFWVILDTLWIAGDSTLNLLVTDLAAAVPAKVLHLVNEDFYVDLGPAKNTVYLGSSKVLGINHNCNGLALFALFCGFIIAFPGPWKSKLWYIPLGIFVLMVANWLRVLALIYTQIHYPGYLDFNHKYTFTFFIFGIAFLLWWIYVEKLSGLREEKR